MIISYLKIVIFQLFLTLKLYTKHEFLYHIVNNIKLNTNFVMHVKKEKKEFIIQ